MDDRKTAQSARFIEAARTLGTDEAEAAFREKLAVIARQKPAPEPVEAEKPSKAKKGG